MASQLPSINSQNLLPQAKWMGIRIQHPLLLKNTFQCSLCLNRTSIGLESHDNYFKSPNIFHKFSFKNSNTERLPIRASSSQVDFSNSYAPNTKSDNSYQPCPNLSFEIQTKILREAIRQISSIVGKGSLPNPILSHLLFQIDEGDNFLTIIASDGILSIKSLVSISTIQSHGRITVPAKRILDLLRGMPDGNLTIIGHDEGCGLTMFNGKSRFKLYGISAMDFPSLPSMSSAFKVVFSCDELLSCLLNTKFATSKDENMIQNLNGINMQIKDKKTLFLASDSRLFACNTCHAIQVDSDANLDVIFPVKTVDEICRILNEYTKSNLKKKSKPKSKSKSKSKSKTKQDEENNEEEEEEKEKEKEEEKEGDMEGDAIKSVVMNVCKERMELILDNGTILTSQLVNSEYPNLTPLLLQKPEVSFLINRTEFMNAMKQMSLFCGKSNSDSKLNSLHLSLNKHFISLSAGSHGLGNAKIRIDVEYAGANFEIGFNPWLFLEILSHLNQNTVNVGLTSKGGGCAIIQNDVDDVDDDDDKKGNSTFLLSAMLGSSPFDDFESDVIPY